MTSELQRAAGFFVGTVAVIGALAVLLPRALKVAGGPETEVVTELKRTERDGFSVAVPGASAPLVSRKHHFDRITVRVEPEAGEAVATATLDFRGVLGATEVSSLGVEQVRFRGKDRWAPLHGPAPRLTAIVSVLERRRRALDQGAGDVLAGLAPGALQDPAVARVLKVQRRAYQASAWFIRAERDEVLVSEEYRLQGDLPDRPVDEKGTLRLTLARKGREFFFSNGLM